MESPFLKRHGYSNFNHYLFGWGMARSLGSVNVTTGGKIGSRDFTSLEYSMLMPSCFILFHFTCKTRVMKSKIAKVLNSGCHRHIFVVLSLLVFVHNTSFCHCFHLDYLYFTKYTDRKIITTNQFNIPLFQMLGCMCLPIKAVAENIRFIIYTDFRNT